MAINFISLNWAWSEYLIGSIPMLRDIEQVVALLPVHTFQAVVAEIADLASGGEA